MTKHDFGSVKRQIDPNGVAMRCALKLCGATVGAWHAVGKKGEKVALNEVGVQESSRGQKLYRQVCSLKAALAFGTIFSCVCFEISNIYKTHQTCFLLFGFHLFWISDKTHECLL